MRASEFSGFENLSFCKTPEDLPEELQRYVIARGSHMPVFSHRYLVAPFPVATPIPLLDALAAVERDVLRFLDKGDPFAAMRYVQKPYMSDALREWEDEGYITWKRRSGHAIFWKLLNLCWTRTELPHLDIDTFRMLFGSDRPYRKLVMNRDERLALAAMPSKFKIWRGVSAFSYQDACEAIETGLSWTTSEKKASWFADRWNGKEGKKAYVACAHVEKDEVVAYFSDRDEDEIVVTEQIDFDLTAAEEE